MTPSEKGHQRVIGAETAFWPPGTFLRAYKANRRDAIETVIEADPVAARVRDIMATQTAWSGNASDLLRIGADPAEQGMSLRDPGWPKSPRALAGRLRRAQTSLRALGIEIAFGREGRAGTRVIRMTAPQQHEPHEPLSIVSTVSAFVSSASDAAELPINGERMQQTCKRC